MKRIVVLALLGLTIVVASLSHGDVVEQAGKHIFPFGQGQWGPLKFTDLAPLPCPSGTETYCTNCTQTLPCAGGGAGAWALCIAGAWSCESGGPDNGLIGIPPTSDGQLAVWNGAFTTALRGATDPANCPGVGEAAAGIDEFGVADGCFVPGGTFAPAGVDGDLQIKAGAILGVYPGTGSCPAGIASIDSQGVETCVATTTTIVTTTTTTTTTTTVATTTTTTLFPITEDPGNRMLIGFRQGNGAAASGASTSSVGVVLDSAITLQGTRTADLNDGDGPWINFATGTTVGNIAGYNVTGGGPYLTGDLSIDTKTDFFFIIKTGPVASDIADVRILLGARCAVLSTSVGDSGHNCAALLFRYSTSAGDTSWQAYAHSEAGAGDETTVDTLIAVTTDTVYILRIDARNPAAVDYYVNDVLVATITTTLPPTTVIMDAQMIANNLANGTARNFKWRKYYQVSGPFP